MLLWQAMVFARTFNLYDELAEVAPNGVIRPQVSVPFFTMPQMGRGPKLFST